MCERLDLIRLRSLCTLTWEAKSPRPGQNSAAELPESFWPDGWEQGQFFRHRLLDSSGPDYPASFAVSMYVFVFQGTSVLPVLSCMESFWILESNKVKFQMHEGVWESKGKLLKQLEGEKKSSLLLKMLSKQQKPRLKLAEANTASWLTQPNSWFLPTRLPWLPRLEKPNACFHNFTRPSQKPCDRSSQWD